MKYIRLILIPFSALYFLIYNVRYILYKFKILKSFSHNIPVIKVGNITTGGTGKTPVTKSIADYFLSKGIRVGIVSRGYKRKSKGLILVYAEGILNCGLDESGDELYMLAKQFDNSENKNSVIVIASEDRNEGINYIYENSLADIVILDDAFQNLSVQSALDIAIVTEAKSILDNLLLPAGNLRETARGLARADIIIFNEKFSNIVHGIRISDVILNYMIGEIANINSGKLESNEANIVCAIGDPDNFVTALNNSGITINSKYFFSDHYNYTPEDAHKIFTSSDLPVITTEKDFHKLYSITDTEFKQRIFFAKLELNFRENYSILKTKLDKLIENRL